MKFSSSEKGIRKLKLYICATLNLSFTHFVCQILLRTAFISISIVCCCFIFIPFFLSDYSECIPFTLEWIGDRIRELVVGGGYPIQRTADPISCKRRIPHVNQPWVIFRILGCNIVHCYRKRKASEALPAQRKMSFSFYSECNNESDRQY